MKPKFLVQLFESRQTRNFLEQIEVQHFSLANITSPLISTNKIASLEMKMRLYARVEKSVVIAILYTKKLTAMSCNCPIHWSLACQFSVMQYKANELSVAH